MGGRLPEDRRDELSLGPARYFVPVCVLTRFGFVGGPSGYREVPADKVPSGPIIVEHEPRRSHHDA